MAVVHSQSLWEIKLSPLIEGYLEIIILRFCPFPPPTSTNFDIPSNPVCIYIYIYFKYSIHIRYTQICHKLVKIWFITVQPGIE